MVDALLNVVFDQLVSITKQELNLVLSVRKDIKHLSSKLQIVQAVLGDAEMKQIKENDVKVWLEQLKDLLYDADDLLDKWNTRINLNNSSQIQGVDGRVGFRKKKVISYFCHPCVSIKSVIVDHRFGTRIKEIREEFDEVIRNKEILMLSPVQSHVELTNQRLTSSVVHVSEIYGRDHDKNVLISKLLSESSHQDLNNNTHVISIVGTGGFGKTTLAKLILEEEQVQEAFEKIMWVCVSDPFNLIEVTKAIIEEAKGTVPGGNQWEALHKSLCDSIKGSQFLLVLDDVWTENTDDWTPFRLSLNGGAPGSRVLVTTRSEKVAQMMGSIHPHNLEELSIDDSWRLFESIVFVGGRQEDLAKLGDIGREICKKCKGVPLAIKIVASFMRNKKTRKEWKDVLGSEIWNIEHIQKEFSPSLFLSYYPLPPISKQCFMYCAIFPKDKKLEKDTLVKLWMAQGFLGSGGDKALEKIGGEYFDDLAMRSFFQNFERDPEGNISSCMMHDLIHDFAEFVANDECYSLGCGKELDVSKVRHMGDYSLQDCSSIYKNKNLRTLWASQSINLITVFDKLTSLRVLDLRWSYSAQFPNKVERLLHLRYLDLSGAWLSELPETISCLYNLQTLILKWCSNLIKLPDGIVELQNLRHLELEETDKLSCLPREIGRLRCLRTLSKFIVGDASNGCNISELKHLCFLQGRLYIEGLGRVADAESAAQAELKKKRLDILSLRFDNSEKSDFENMSGVLENLQPHEDVQELKIYGFKGFQFPSWFSNNSMLTNLVRLRLVECEKSTELPALGNLVSLEELEIERMSCVKHIGIQFYGVAAFPKLKKLEISEMSELIEWELPISTDAKTIIMPCLQVLKLKSCLMLRELPGLGGLESLDCLIICNLSSIKQVGPEFWGVSAGEFSDVGGDGDEELIQEQRVISFPKLTKLKITGMGEWEEWIVPPFKEDRETIIMPCLRQFTLYDCKKLVKFEDPEYISLSCLYELELRFCGFHVIPCFLFPHTLRQMKIVRCENLIGMQPCLPPHLESLKLKGHVGILSESLPIGGGEEFSHDYLSLQSFKIYSSKQPSLPKGFNHLTAIRHLIFHNCEFLDFNPNELKHLTMLQDLEINFCPILEERFQSSKDDWLRILSHVPNIKISEEIIKESH